MSRYKLSQIFIYPVKSLCGIELKSATVTDRGLQFDRRWMLVDENGRFLSQRTVPKMSLIKTALLAEALHFNFENSEFEIPLAGVGEMEIEATVWNDKVSLKLVGNGADEWFSGVLGLKCQLVYMPEEAQRRVDPNYARNGEITSLSDGYPFLLIGQSSLDDLNARLDRKITMNRFRPNLVFTGGIPFEEDTWKFFSIGGVEFFPVKPCSRCVVTTINLETGLKEEEPLRTLASYRAVGNKIYFGQNLLHRGTGIISAGDELIITGRK